MDYAQWIKLFDKPADDIQVRSLLAKSGITDAIKINREELSVAEDIEGQGMTIIFTSETILHPAAGGIVGRPILSGLIMELQTKKRKSNFYMGSLPCELKKDLSQTTVRDRLGAPLQINEEYRTDAWIIDGLELAVTYAEDLQSLTQVSVSLPESG